MKQALKQFFKSIAIQLPVYAALVTVYILVVLKFLAAPLNQWFKSDRRIYAAAALVLIIGQGFVLELTTRVLDRAARKKQRP